MGYNYIMCYIYKIDVLYSRLSTPNCWYQPLLPSRKVSLYCTSDIAAQDVVCSTANHVLGRRFSTIA